MPGEGVCATRRGSPRDHAALVRSRHRVLWFIEHGNEGQLEVKKRYGLKSVVVCNLRQLLGWSKVGTPKGGRDDRDKRKEVANFQIVYAAEKLASTETVQWLQHVTGGEAAQHDADNICRRPHAGSRQDSAMLNVRSMSMLPWCSLAKECVQPPCGAQHWRQSAWSGRSATLNRPPSSIQPSARPCGSRQQGGVMNIRDSWHPGRVGPGCEHELRCTQARLPGF